MKVNETEIKIIQGDITKLAVDAIVNAANNKLMGGGGVDGAIHKAAGPDLLRSCMALGGCKTGEAKITMGYNLPAKFVIHTVGPVYKEQGDYAASYLEDCYKNSLELADKHKITSIAFPSISTGAYGYPIEEAAPIALETTQEYIKARPLTNITEIIFVCFSSGDYNIYKQLSSEIFN